MKCQHTINLKITMSWAQMSMTVRYREIPGICEMGLLDVG
jgi:hypothetical protein